MKDTMKYVISEVIKNIDTDEGTLINYKTYKEALEDSTKFREKFMQKCKNDNEVVEILLDNEDKFKASINDGNTIYSITIIELQ